MELVQKAIQDTGGLTGNLSKDRENVRAAMGRIKKFKGITGEMTFSGGGDPSKCAVIVRISDKGLFEFYKSACP
jgi:branched-chain amino acid transport system substrate-binding protein